MRVYEARIQYNLVSLGEDVVLDTPAKVTEYVKDLYEANPVQEQFVVIMVDRKNHPIARQVVTTGTLTGSLVGARETFRAAILANAASIIASHNHPSGSPEPSQADCQVTRQLRQAGDVLGIQLVDHVIVGTQEGDPAGKGYYSFREAGLI
jgi:DNA repair protein RadC